MRRSSSDTLRELRAFYCRPGAIRRLVRMIERRLGHELLGQIGGGEDRAVRARRTRGIDLPGSIRSLSRHGHGARNCWHCSTICWRDWSDLGVATVAAAGLAPATISTLYFTGGSSGMTALRDAFASAFPGKPRRRRRPVRQRGQRPGAGCRPALRPGVEEIVRRGRQRRRPITMRVRSHFPSFSFDELSSSWLPTPSLRSNPGFPVANRGSFPVLRHSTTMHIRQAMRRWVRPRH